MVFGWLKASLQMGGSLAFILKIPLKNTNSMESKTLCYSQSDWSYSSGYDVYAFVKLSL